MNIPVTKQQVQDNENLVSLFPNRQQRRAIKQNPSGGNRKLTLGRIKGMEALYKDKAGTIRYKGVTYPSIWHYAMRGLVNMSAFLAEKAKNYKRA